MDWGKVVYVFFSLMSLTSIAGFLYENTAASLFVAASLNLVSTFLKLGVRNLLSAELLASSLVADLHLIPAFFMFQFGNTTSHEGLITGLVVGAIIANLYTLVVSIVESAKTKEEF